MFLLCHIYMCDSRLLDIIMFSALLSIAPNSQCGRIVANIQNLHTCSKAFGVMMQISCGHRKSFVSESQLS